MEGESGTVAPRYTAAVAIISASTGLTGIAIPIST
jgi:hypothetical protein